MTTDQPEGAGASSVPDDPEQLKQDIERTREQLGQTVEALVAKADTTEVIWKPEYPRRDRPND